MRLTPLKELCSLRCQLLGFKEINPELVTDLIELVSAGFCKHKSFGLGKIIQLNAMTSKFTIDFSIMGGWRSRADHKMDLNFAAKKLTPIILYKSQIESLGEYDILSKKVKIICFIEDNDKLTKCEFCNSFVNTYKIKSHIAYRCTQVSSEMFTERRKHVERCPHCKRLVLKKGSHIQKCGEEVRRARIGLKLFGRKRNNSPSFPIIANPNGKPDNYPGEPG
jgi:hypothetical protein